MMMPTHLPTDLQGHVPGDAQPGHIPSDQLSWDTQVSLKHVVESMPIAVVIVNSHGRIVYVNGKLEEMFGYERDELLGRMVEILLPDHFRRSHVTHRQEYMVHPHVRSMGSGMDLAGKRKDGSYFALEAGLSSLTLDHETYVVATITDISKRKQVAEVLALQVEDRNREVERRKATAESLRSTINILISNRPLAETLDFIATQAESHLSATACAIYAREAHTGKLQSHVERGSIPSDFVQALQTSSAQAETLYREPLVFTAGMAPTPAFGFSLASPTLSPTLSTSNTPQAAYLSVPIRDSQEIYGLFLLAYGEHSHIADQDIEVALRFSDLTVLAFANAHLRTQIEHSAVAAERSRIARDLHDAVTQTLFSASIIAGVLPTIWQRNEEEGRRRLDELRELTRGALAEMRTLLLELRPAKLVEVDLADLLRQLAEAISGRVRIPVTVHVEGNTDVTADIKVALYRVAQEALNNIAKHAQARSVLIRLVRSPDKITLTVSDDGMGFVFESIAPQHLGLGIMRERADAIGATMMVQSSPGNGTTIEVCWSSHETTATNHPTNPQINHSIYRQPNDE